MPPYRIGNVNLDHLIKADLSAFFQCKITIFPFVIHNLWRDTLSLVYILFLWFLSFIHHS